MVVSIWQEDGYCGGYTAGKVNALCSVYIYILQNRLFEGGRMYKKLIILLLTFALLLYGCAGKEEKPKVGNATPGNATQPPVTHPNTTANVSQHEESGALAECEKIEDKIILEDCFIQVAAITGNWSICKGLRANESCYYAVASATQNLSLCDEISPSIFSKRGICYETIEKVKQDVEFCRGVKNNTLKNFCYVGVAIGKNDSKVCDELEHPDYCYFRVGDATKDPRICEKIADELQRGSCYASTADVHRNISICKNITNSITVSGQMCYSGVANVTKNSSICDMIDKVDMREECYLSIGVANADLSECDKIKGYYLTSCYVQVYVALAYKKGDLSLCALLLDKWDYEDYVESCYEGAARKLKNVSLCDRAKISFKDSCYLGVAEETLNPSICDEISDSFSKSICYQRIGMKTNNATICDKISNPLSFEMCYGGIPEITQNLSACDKLIFNDDKYFCRAEIMANQTK